MLLLPLGGSDQAPYCRGYGGWRRGSREVRGDGPVLQGLRTRPTRRGPDRQDSSVHRGCPSGAWVARRWASGRPRGGRQRSARALSASSSGEGPARRLSCLVEERDHHPRGRRESSSTIRPVPAGNARCLPVPGPQPDHQPRPGRKHLPEDARGAYLPSWSTTPPRPRLLLPDLTERITVFSIDNSATRRCDGTYGSHVGGPLDCGQGWARRPLYDAPTRIKDLRAVQRAHQRPDRSNR